MIREKRLFQQKIDNLSINFIYDLCETTLDIHHTATGFHHPNKQCIDHHYALPCICDLLRETLLTHGETPHLMCRCMHNCQKHSTAMKIHRYKQQAIQTASKYSSHTKGEKLTVSCEKPSLHGPQTVRG